MKLGSLVINIKKICFLKKKKIDNVLPGGLVVEKIGKK